MARLPPFAAGRRWNKRASKADKQVDRRVWHCMDDDFEYEQDPNPSKGTWHRIDWRRGWYQEIDATTGEPVAGGEGQWRLLK